MSRITSASIFYVRSAKLHPVIVELQTDDGFVGIGESAVSFGIGGSATAEMIRDFCDQVILGKDPDNVEGLWSEMFDRSVWARGGGPITFGAMSAIEIALWDIKGKRLGVPVYQLLGGSIRDKISVYANGWNYEHHDPLSWARAAERPLADGYDAIKCYPLAVPAQGAKTLVHVPRCEVSPELLALGRDRVRMLRDVVGGQVTIRLDICGAVAPYDMIKFCRMVEEFNIDWVEEPAHPSDVAAHDLIARQSTIPLATGERLYSRFGFRDLIESGSVSIIQPDVGTTGGIAEVRKIAAAAEAYGQKLAPHNCASGISTAANLHIAASTRNFHSLEVFPYFRHLEKYVEVLDDNPELKIASGKLEPPSAPGLGVTLSKVTRNHLWAACELGR